MRTMKWTGAWLGLLAAGCGAEQGGEVEPAAASAGIASDPTEGRITEYPTVEPGRSSLDDRRYPAPRDGGRSLPAEIEMYGGRLSRVPASAAYRTSLSLDGWHRFQVRNRGCSGDEDTAMLVTFTLDGKSYTYVNDDHSLGEGNGRCSFVDAGWRYGRVIYQVTVFSQRRSTARLNLWKTTGKGDGWQLWKDGENVGGTLIRLGAMADGEYVEVETRSDGMDEENTALVLFQAPATLRNDGTDRVEHAAIYGSDQDYFRDRDPRVVVDATWNVPETYVLVHKTGHGPLANGNRRVEAHVDVTRGPEQPLLLGTLASTSSGVRLEPGRYVVSFNARLGSPVGHFTDDPASQHPAGTMPGLADDNGETDGCPVPEKDGAPAQKWFRGQHNERAFVMWVERSTDRQAWSVASPRRPVLRGAFGSDPDLRRMERFALDLGVAEAAYYRLMVETLAPDLVMGPFFAVGRNPQTSEIRLATANVLYNAHARTANELRNYANLLGPRGSVRGGSSSDLSQLRVEEPDTQGPFQWDADVFGMQEFNVTNDDGELERYYAEIVRAEAQARGSQAWSYVISRGESWFSGAGDGPGLSPIFVRQSSWPAGTEENIRFSRTATEAGPSGGGCSRSGFWDGYITCPLDDGGGADIQNYMAPAKVSSYRGEQQPDRPIAVFNLHLESSKGAADFRARRNELDDAIRTIKDLLLADPRAFNAVGDTNPRGLDNRMILFGDFNTRTHECGEHYWFVRELREHFGYAVDTAMATPDRFGNATLGMHTRDDGYDPGPAGWPVGFQYAFWSHPALVPAWSHEIPRNHTPFSRYSGQFTDHRKDALHPWWASTGRTETGGYGQNGERYDFVVLVGLGWSLDDAVLEYKVMTDRNRNALNSGSLMDATGRAVEMWTDCSNDSVLDAGDPDYVEGLSYQPNWDVGCGTQPGSAALKTDHRPVGVRLRVWK